MGINSELKKRALSLFSSVARNTLLATGPLAPPAATVAPFFAGFDLLMELPVLLEHASHKSGKRPVRWGDVGSCLFDLMRRVIHSPACRHLVITADESAPEAKRVEQDRRRAAAASSKDSDAPSGASVPPGILDSAMASHALGTLPTNLVPRTPDGRIPTKEIMSSSTMRHHFVASLLHQIEKGFSLEHPAESSMPQDSLERTGAAFEGGPGLKILIDGAYRAYNPQTADKSRAPDPASRGVAVHHIPAGCKSIATQTLYPSTRVGEGEMKLINQAFLAIALEQACASAENKQPLPMLHAVIYSSDGDIIPSLLMNVRHLVEPVSGCVPPNIALTLAQKDKESPSGYKYYDIIGLFRSVASFMLMYFPFCEAPVEMFCLILGTGGTDYLDSFPSLGPSAIMAAFFENYVTYSMLESLPKNQQLVVVSHGADKDGEEARSESLLTTVAYRVAVEKLAKRGGVGFSLLGPSFVSPPGGGYIAGAGDMGTSSSPRSKPIRLASAMIRIDEGAIFRLVVGAYIEMHKEAFDKAYLRRSRYLRSHVVAANPSVISLTESSLSKNLAWTTGSSSTTMRSTLTGAPSTPAAVKVPDNGMAGADAAWDNDPIGSDSARRRANESDQQKAERFEKDAYSSLGIAPLVQRAIASGVSPEIAAYVIREGLKHFWHITLKGGEELKSKLLEQPPREQMRNTFAGGPGALSVHIDQLMQCIRLREKIISLPVIVDYDTEITLLSRSNSPSASPSALIGGAPRIYCGSHANDQSQCHHGCALEVLRKYLVSQGKSSQAEKLPSAALIRSTARRLAWQLDYWANGPLCERQYYDPMERTQGSNISMWGFEHVDAAGFPVTRKEEIKRTVFAEIVA